MAQGAVSLRLSLTMIVKDEAAHLAASLGSVAAVVDEMVLVDTGSTDATVEQALRFGARVLRRPWRDDFAAARNEALAAARGEWVLVMDADERFVGEKRRLWQALKDPRAVAFLVPIENVLADGSRNLHAAVRLFRRLPGIRFQWPIHEQVLPSIVRRYPRRTVGVAPCRLLHLGYLPEEVARKDKRRRNLALAKAEVAARPHDAFARLNLATELFALGDALGALDHLCVAEEHLGPPEPWQTRLFTLLCRALLDGGDPGRAADAARRGLERFAGFTDLYHLLGLAHERQGEVKAAERAYRLALDLGPASSPPFDGVDPDVGGAKTAVALARLLTGRGRLNEAKDWLVRAAELRPADLAGASAWVELLAKTDLDRHDVFAAPWDPLALGAALHRGGYPRLALEAFARAEAVHPDLPYDHVLVKVQSLLALGEAKEAERELRRGGAPPQGHPRAYVADAVWYATGKLSLAEAQRRYPATHPFWRLGASAPAALNARAP